jgi:xanthine dehydrogenase accessory factor
MREVLHEIDRWRAAGESVALATVVRTWGSAPRAVGSRMAIARGGGIAGSVSGGCVEGAVVEAGREVLASGRPRLLNFGVADETAWSVGISCGGVIEVFVEPLDPRSYDAVRGELLAERSAVLAEVVKGPGELVGCKLLLREDGRVEGSLAGLDQPALEAAQAALAEGRSRRVDLPGETPVELFVEALRPSPTLAIVGGVHIAVALTALARTLGYRTIVVDPRRAFGNAERFAHAERVVQAWPDQALGEIGLTASTAVAVLTHDPKLDDPALRAALPSPAFYVGALGSKATQEKRRRRLLEAGVSEAQLARLHAPIGLELGGRSPEEIALAVMAQIVAERNKPCPR